MRDRMERLVVLPFSMGCVSQSSVAISQNHSNKSKPDPNPYPISEGGGEERLSGVKVKNSQSHYGFLPLPKPNISSGLHRLTKRFSQLFLYKEEVEEMEIGYPTDVKHVTHIGWDGSASATTTQIKGWDNLKAHELLSLPSLSLRQFS